MTYVLCRTKDIDNLELLDEIQRFKFMKGINLTVDETFLVLRLILCEARDR
jgi:hypothetical protein